MAAHRVASRSRCSGFGVPRGAWVAVAQERDTNGGADMYLRWLCTTHRLAHVTRGSVSHVEPSCRPRPGARMQMPVLRRVCDGDESRSSSLPGVQARCPAGALRSRGPTNETRRAVMAVCRVVLRSYADSVFHVEPFSRRRTGTRPRRTLRRVSAIAEPHRSQCPGPCVSPESLLSASSRPRDTQQC
jgi:hypothetical protein